MIFSCGLNNAKPLLSLSRNILISTNFGTDRLYYAREYHGDDRVERFKDLVPAGADVALVTSSNSWTYHFHLINSQIRLEPTNFSSFKENPALYDYLLCLDVDCNISEISVPSKVLWKSLDKSLKGKLIQINYSL